MATNVEKLQTAGLLHGEHCDEAHAAAINGLHDHEVDALISVHSKVSDHLEAPEKAKDSGRPWIL